ncbi:MAG: nucleotidyltransferase domain-containing protein, partial [Nanoarchaeota archaeon]
YKNEGKNKIFFIKNNLKAKNYIYSAEIHKLNKLLKKHPELSIIFEDIKKTFTKGLIILFGSYAKGNSKQDSDIDIYLETNNNKIKEKIKEINSRLSLKIGKFDTKSLLVKEIIKNHMIIRGLEEFYERVDFFKEA